MGIEVQEKMSIEAQEIIAIHQHMRAEIDAQREALDDHTLEGSARRIELMAQRLGAQELVIRILRRIEEQS